MIEEGTYRAKSRRAALGESSTGKEQIGVEWGLIDGPGDCAGKTITSYHFFSSDKAIEISMEQLRAGGFRGNDITDLSSLQADANPPEVELVIVHETYDGKTRAKVRFVNTVGGLAMSKPLDDTRQRAFAARMRGSIAAFDAAQGQAPTRASKPAPRPAPAGPPDDFQATDDDVPF